MDLRKFAERVRPWYDAVSPVGRAVVVAAPVCWLLTVWLGWQELGMAAMFCLVVMVIAVGFAMGRPLLRVTLELNPRRVFVGTPVAGRLMVTNVGRRRLLPLHVDLPIGEANARFDVPSLAPDMAHEDVFVVPTNRRAVVTVGPAVSVRSDPLGLIRRTAAVAEATEFFVHPRIVGLGAMGAGLLRDLEGQTTRNLSVSDLAFHTLRDYAPGDDRRYVHWRSSARLGSLGQDDRLLVRQFLDTRRSRVTIVVDGAPSSYGSDDEFETAISVAASLGVRALREELEVTVVAGTSGSSPKAAVPLLDAMARADRAATGHALTTLAAQTAAIATDTTVAILVTGPNIGFAELRGAAMRFGPDVTPLAIRVEPDAPVGLSRSGGMTVLALRTVDDLPALFAAGVAA